MHRIKSCLQQIGQRAFAPVDIASLVFFRVAFGGLMVGHMLHYFFHGRIANMWINPRFHFKYAGFSWVEPWPGNGLYIHCAVLAVLALFITLGLFYRASAILFCLGYTYLFLIDAATWVNHTYLICLLSFLLFLVPAHRAFSIDARLRPRLRSQMTPAWALWLLRTQMGLVYFFAGIAKLSPDWLQAEPLRIWLPSFSLPILGQVFQFEWTFYAFSYGALFLDLFAVALLLWRRTRMAFFCVATMFHLFNAYFFYIGIFPYLAIAGTTLFLDPDWPRRALSILGLKLQPAVLKAEDAPSSFKRMAVLSFAAIYIAIQVLVPLRPFLHRGGVEWVSAEHRFCWRMMLVDEWVQANFYVMDPNSGETFHVLPQDYLLPWQIARMGWHSDLTVEFAHYLAKVMPRSGWKPLRVEARVLIALNGRKPSLVFNQNVDLAAEELPWGRPKWLLEIHEPLPPQSVPRERNPFADEIDTNQARTQNGGIQ